MKYKQKLKYIMYTILKVQKKMDGQEADRFIDDTIERSHHEWLQRIVGANKRAQFKEFLILRITWDELKENQKKREKKLKQRIQELENELNTYKTSDEDIIDTFEPLELLKM